MKITITELIHIDPSLFILVYKQIIQSIYSNIESGIFNKEALLPSVSRIPGEFSLVRRAVFNASIDLKASSDIGLYLNGYFVLCNFLGKALDKINQKPTTTNPIF